MLRRHLRHPLLLAILCLLLLAAGQAAPTSAQQPVNVTLASFDAIPLYGSVRLEWSTDTEINLAGFFFRRGHDGVFVDLDQIGFVPGTGGDVSGADYTAVDEAVTNGETYTYQLFELETNGNEVELASETVTVPLEPSPTPVTIGGGNSGGATATPPPVSVTPSRTPTVTPTRTPSATATSSGAAATATLLPATTATPPAVVVATLAAPAVTAPAATAPPVLVIEDEAAAPAEDALPAGPIVTAGPLPTLPAPTAVAEPNNASANPGAGGQGVAFALPAEREAPVPITSRPTPPADDGAQLQAEPPAATSGRILLWAGFVAALLLFVASILGSIYLFTRRQQDDR